MTTPKSAIVTGGERGIGRAIATALLDDGFSVSIVGYDQQAAKDLPQDLPFYHCDMADYLAVAKTIQSICVESEQLHALVCNAGIASPQCDNIEEIDIADWQRVLDVNLSGPFYCAKAAAPFLRKAKGSIVTIASTRAAMSEPNTFAYSASKGALVSLTHCLAISLGPNIRVNSVSPGWILTNPTEPTTEADKSQHPVGRIGEPADIAEMVAYLVSDKAGFITAQNLTIDGGMTKKMIYE